MLLRLTEHAVDVEVEVHVVGVFLLTEHVVAVRLVLIGHVVKEVKVYVAGVVFLTEHAA